MAFIKEALASTNPPKLTLYARSPSKLPPGIEEHARVVKGELDSEESLSTAMEGVDTVVSLLVSCRYNLSQTRHHILILEC